MGQEEYQDLRERLKRMIQLGFVRHVEPGETRAPTDAELIELTVDGVELVAAQQGLSIAQAIRHNGLVGGGPQQEIGARHLLLRNLQHTLGADTVFVELYRRLGAATATSGTVTCTRPGKPELSIDPVLTMIPPSRCAAMNCAVCSFISAAVTNQAAG